MTKLNWNKVVIDRMGSIELPKHMIKINHDVFLGKLKFSYTEGGKLKAFIGKNVTFIGEPKNVEEAKKIVEDNVDIFKNVKTMNQLIKAKVKFLAK